MTPPMQEQDLVKNAVENVEQEQQQQADSPLNYADPVELTNLAVEVGKDVLDAVSSALGSIDISF